MGALVTAEGTVFRIWSTVAKRAEVQLRRPDDDRDERIELIEVDAQPPALTRGGRVLQAVVRDAPPGTLYSFVLDGKVLPDPYARFLPRGVHGPARVESPRLVHVGHTPRPLKEWVIYELHVGTFTPEGTFRAAAEKLAYLQKLGVNAVELMPVSSFDGQRGWGYDGVAHFAPHAPYGEPDDLRAFVAQAHELGLSVILDVVYNHFGPSGNYLSAYAPAYFNEKVSTPWGAAPDLANPWLRALVVENARYWLEEFGFDALRLDATHEMHDPSEVHVLAEIARMAASCTPPRLVMAEDDRNDPSLVAEHGLSALWADDFHHQVRVVLTGEQDGYFACYRRSVDDLVRTIERGWLYEGQSYPTHGRNRGFPADQLLAEQLVYCIQNHDQIGNRALGDRLSRVAGIDGFAAASMLLLFLPMVPLIFQGQEWAASTPFLYFTDHERVLGEAITKGRRAEFAGFAAFSDPGARQHIPDPQAEQTFLASKLRWDELEAPNHARILALYRAMLKLRQTDPVMKDADRRAVKAVAEGSVLRVTRGTAADFRTLVVNFGQTPVPLGASLDQPEVVLASGPLVDGNLPTLTAVILRGGVKTR